MLLALSAATSSTLRPSRLAFASSRNLIRSVAMRPGKIMLALRPSLPTSRARVLDQPTNESRSAFEMARFGIGDTTPDEVLVIMRPHFFSRIFGRSEEHTSELQ